MNDQPLRMFYPSFLFEDPKTVNWLTPGAMCTYLMDLEGAIGKAHTLFLLRSFSSFGKTDNSSADLITVYDI